MPKPIPGWRTDIVAALTGFDPGSFTANFLHGLVYYLPIMVVTYLGGFLWEGLFAWKRGHEINEGFFVTGILFSLTLPPTIPLWLVFLGITFGVVIGKEVFGGTGKNFLNPALVGRVFLFFAYPAYMTGDTVWTAVDNYTGATALATAKGADSPSAASAALEQAGFQWKDTFFGTIPGSIGETSTLMIAIGGIALLIFKVASWRIMAAVVVGMIGSVLLFNAIGSDTNPDVRAAVVLASDDGRVCVRRRLHGDRSGLRRDDRYRKMDLRHPDRVHGYDDPCGQPGIPRRHDARDTVRQSVCTVIDYCVLQANIRRRLAREHVI